MNSETFDIIYNKWINKEKTGKPFWKDLAIELNYKDGEYLRSDFKHERSRRGLLLNKKELLYDNDNFPKICVFDIEFAPMQVYTFGLWDQNITPDKIITDGYVLCWSAKMLNDPKIELDVIEPFLSKDGDDYDVIQHIHQYLDKCQIVIGHNIKEYDLKTLNTRFLYYGFYPLSQFQVIDTLTVAKNNFRFPSNSLKYINKFLDIKQKDETEGFQLWKNCTQGDEESLSKLGKYCKNDVLATEELYYKFRPYIKTHPNMGLYFETTEPICKNCGSKNLMSNGFYYTNVSKYESVRCGSCGALGRKKDNLVSKEQRKALVR